MTAEWVLVAIFSVLGAAGWFLWQRPHPADAVWDLMEASLLTDPHSWTKSEFGGFLAHKSSGYSRVVHTRFGLAVRAHLQEQNND